MKLNLILIGLFLGCILLMLYAFGCPRAHADNAAGPAMAAPGYTGYLTVAAPVWNSQSGTISGTQPLEVSGKGVLTNLFGNNCALRPFVSGDYTLGRRVFQARSEIQGGAEYSVNRDCTFFSYYDHHFLENVDRVWVGLRLNFRG